MAPLEDLLPLRTCATGANRTPSLEQRNSGTAEQRNSGTAEQRNGGQWTVDSGQWTLTVSSTSRTPTGWRMFPGVNRGKALVVQGHFRTDDTEALLQGSEAGIGIVHLASWLVSDAIAAGRLVSLFPAEHRDGEPQPPAIHAVRLKGRSHAAKAQLFIAHLKTAFGSPTHWDLAVSSALHHHGR